MVQVDENMQKAQQRDAARLNTYAFRREVFPSNQSPETYDLSSRPVSPPPPSSAQTTSSGVPPLQSASTFHSHSRHPSASAGPSSPRATRAAPSLATANGNGYGYSYDPHARSSSCASRASSCPSPTEEEEDLIVDMTVDEIINGRGDFPGLMGLVNAYLNSINVDLATKCELRRYLDLIKLRAKGESTLTSHVYARDVSLADADPSGDLVTPASWIRNFIVTHPKYAKDSKVTEEINYDLTRAIDEV